MNAQEQAEKNILIDVLFDQIEALDELNALVAGSSIRLWRIAKEDAARDGLPMQARIGYSVAYDRLVAIGLEVGGMIKPDPDNRDMLYH